RSEQKGNGPGDDAVPEVTGHRPGVRQILGELDRRARGRRISRPLRLEGDGIEEDPTALVRNEERQTAIRPLVLDLVAPGPPARRRLDRNRETARRRTRDQLELLSVVRNRLSLCRERRLVKVRRA